MKRSAALLLLAWGLVPGASLVAQIHEGLPGGTILTARTAQLPEAPGGTHDPPPEPAMARPVPPPERSRFPGEDRGRMQPNPRPESFDAPRARREAEELAALAQKIPQEVDRLAKNTLPKDVIRELKQIEKLAKHLRSEISR